MQKVRKYKIVKWDDIKQGDRIYGSWMEDYCGSSVKGIVLSIDSESALIHQGRMLGKTSVGREGYSLWQRLEYCDYPDGWYRVDFDGKILVRYKSGEFSFEDENCLTKLCKWGDYKVLNQVSFKPLPLDDV